MIAAAGGLHNPAMQGLRSLKRWWRVNRGWLHYKLRHPRAPFHRYYVSQLERRLDGGEVHVTLGVKSAESDAFQETGRAIVELLREHGLRPEHRVLDYGCGSLRVGRHLIEHLEPGGYVGLDVTERFFSDGLATLDPSLVAAKRPHLALVSDAELERLAADPPDFVVSIGVLMHVPRPEVPDYLASFRRASGERTQVFLSFLEEDGHRQIGELTWAWPSGLVIDELARHGFSGGVVSVQTGGFPAAAPGRSRTIVRAVRTRR